MAGRYKKKPKKVKKAGKVGRQSIEAVIEMALRYACKGVAYVYLDNGKPRVSTKLPVGGDLVGIYTGRHGVVRPLVSEDLAAEGFTEGR